MEVKYLQVDDLVYGHEAAAATGVPETVIRKWASRGKIHRFPAKHARGGGPPQGNGHMHRTMYALPEIQTLAKTYQATPQRAPKTA